MGTVLCVCYINRQVMTQRCSIGHVGIEDSAGGSAMPRSTLLVIMGAPADTGRAARIIKCAQLWASKTSQRM